MQIDALTALWAERTGQRLSHMAQKTLVAAMADFTDGQIIYGYRDYIRQTIEPSYNEFIWWMADLELPDDLICRALTAGGIMGTMARDVVAIEAAWFPTPGETHVTNLRRKLERALL